MERVIKFRGRRFDNNEWIYGYYSVFNGNYAIMEDGGLWLKIIPESVGQFTGLKDKNKKEIYFEDIVISGLHKHFPYERKCVVEDRSGSIYLSPTGNTVGDYLVNFKKGNIEVVGNIYENTDLLNK